MVLLKRAFLKLKNALKLLKEKSHAKNISHYQKTQQIIQIERQKDQIRFYVETKL